MDPQQFIDYVFQYVESTPKTRNQFLTARSNSDVSIQREGTALYEEAKLGFHRSYRIGKGKRTVYINWMIARQTPLPVHISSISELTFRGEPTWKGYLDVSYQERGEKANHRIYLETDLQTITSITGKTTVQKADALQPSLDTILAGIHVL